jgi:hypothetical protein
LTANELRSRPVHRTSITVREVLRAILDFRESISELFPPAFPKDQTTPLIAWVIAGVNRDWNLAARRMKSERRFAPPRTRRERGRL